MGKGQLKRRLMNSFKGPSFLPSLLNHASQRLKGGAAKTARLRERMNREAV